MAKRIPSTDTGSRNLLEGLGTRLRAARLRRAMTQSDLATQVDVAIPTLRKLEAGDPTTSLATLLRVLNVLGLDADLNHLAAFDAEGQRLQDEKLTRPAPTRRHRFAM